ncbi:protein LURP-one-related 11-like [Andrographis paniculata]|uniref:protein LURP-one-related 11-like n=1 Tax=Andrographis paniculata TaxID=175694 RepID=UPI0021E90A84|nr:protein LURP-one-related 11-like [Andrographis paniculata]
MAKIHPKAEAAAMAVELQTTTTSCSSQRPQEAFTVWMKSLVINGNGCTVFDSAGRLVFRVDNYQTKCCKEALLMDCTGQVLFSIKTQKKALVNKSWRIHKWIDSKNVTEKGEWFEVRRKSGLFRRDITCHATLGCNRGEVTTMLSIYTIEGIRGKSTVKIHDGTGRVLAEMVQKQVKDGVCLGDDVLSLTVEPHADRSLIMALVLVYAMINQKM